MKLKFDILRGEFARHAFIAALSADGIVSTELSDKNQKEDGIDVKLLIDGKEQNFEHVFNRFEEHFEYAVNKRAKALADQQVILRNQEASEDDE